MIQKRPCRMEAEGWVLKTNDFDLTGGLKKRSNLGGGENIAGRNMHPPWPPDLGRDEVAGKNSALN
jgi:hypothetical protein